MKKFSFLFFTSIFIFFTFACSDEKYDICVSQSDPDVYLIENVVHADSIENHNALSEQNEKEWLLLFYIAADNKETNDSLFYQMAQIGKGLRSVYKFDGTTPKNDYNNITAVGLWDGFNADINISTYEYYLPFSFAFEFKYPEQTTTFSIAKSYRNFCIDHSNEIKLSDYNWLNPEQEVNTADSKTLSDFLKWALSNYNSQNNKNVALIITGFGGGSFGEETGSYTPPSARATACDYSSESYFLNASDIVKALQENNFNEDNKLPLLIIDSSFSASLEDAFEYKDCVKGLIASPSSVQGGGIDFNYMLQAFRKTSSIYSIGTEIVNNYANRNFNGGTQLTDEQNSLTFMDICNITDNNNNIITELGNNLNEIADIIIKSKTNENEYSLVDKKYTFFECMSNAIKETPYAFLDYTDNSMQYPNFITDYTMAYKAKYMHRIPKQDFFWGYFYQHDIAYMIHAISRVAEKNGLSNIYYYSNQLKKNLSQLIVSSWRNGTGTKAGLYPVITEKAVEEFQKSTGAKPGKDFITPVYGLTITGQAKIQSKEYLQPYNFSDFSFRNYRLEGKSNWKDLLENLFPEQFKECNFYEY